MPPISSEAFFCFGAANNQTLSYTANGFLVLSRQFVSDAAGNVTGDTDVGSGTTATFIYNDPGQLSAVETGATPMGAYTYDYLSRLVVLEQLTSAGANKHVHFMTPDWGGNELDDETQSEGVGIINMKSYGTINLGRDTDHEIHCDIIRIYPVDGNEWACDLIIKKPFSKSFTIYGTEKSDTLKNAMNFVAGFSTI